MTEQIRPENKEAIAVIDEHFKGDPVEIDEPEPLQIVTGCDNSATGRQ